MKAKHIVFILLVSLILCSCKIVIEGDSAGYTGNEYYDFSYKGCVQTIAGDTSIGIPVSPSSGNIFHVLSFSVANRSYIYRQMDMFNSAIVITLSNGSYFYGKFHVVQMYPGYTGTLNVYFEMPRGYSLNNARITFRFKYSSYPYETYASTCDMRLPSDADPRNSYVSQAVQGIYAYKSPGGSVDALYGFLGENAVKVYSTGKAGGFYYGYAGNNLRMFYTSNNSEEPRKVSDLIRLGDSTIMESLYNGSGSDYNPAALSGIWFTPDNKEGFEFDSSKVKKYSWNGSSYTTEIEPWYCRMYKLYIQESGVYKDGLFGVSASSTDRYLVYKDSVYTKRTAVPAVL